jgi:hypothetical protein
MAAIDRQPRAGNKEICLTAGRVQAGSNPGFALTFCGYWSKDR